MEGSLIEFVDCLRRQGVRASTAEVVDAASCASQPGVLADRARLHAALRAALVTRLADVSTFDDVFALYFSLRPVPGSTADAAGSLADLDGGGPGTPAEDLADLELVDGTQGTAPMGAASGEADMREFFDPDSLRHGQNLDDDASIVDLAAMTDEVSFSPSGANARGAGMKVQLDVSRTHATDAPGSLSPATGQALDLELTGEEEDRLLTWLGAGGTTSDDHDVDEEQLRGLLERLPEHLAEHLRRLAGLRRSAVREEVAPVVLDDVSEIERQLLEESLRRLARSLDGGLSQRFRTHPRGRVDGARTARRSLRYDGIPFQPVTVARVRDRPRVVVLADVSLSVRATARFTLHVVHGMQQMFGHARSFAFVDEVREITGLFETHPVEHALGLVFGGDVVDVDASSDYGTVFADFLEEHGNALDRRTCVLVLGDGRGNGKDPGMDAFTEITRRARSTVWLTPEPSYSWHLGSCDLPRYAALCDRVEVVRDLSGLERTSHRFAELA